MTIKSRMIRRGSTMLAVAALATAAHQVCGAVYTGVLYASLDQPRINAYISVTPDGAPITSDALGGSFNIQAFLDTGASGMLLSDQSRDLLELAYAQHNGQDIIFSDVGVGGSQPFHVSEAFYVHSAAFNDTVEVDVESSYSMPTGPVRFQLADPVDFGDPTDGLDVFGMPLIRNKVIVMDARPTNTLVEVFPGFVVPNTMATYLYSPDKPFNPSALDTDPGIVPTELKIRTSKASFDRFTTVTPVGAPGPTLADNPFIGPAPFSTGDTTPGIRVTRGSRSVTGSFLFDTGAAVSFLSRDLASQLGVRYVAGTYNSDNPQLEYFNPDNPAAPGVLIPADLVFETTIAGIGGTVERLGTYFDSMLISTVMGVAYDPNDPLNIRFDDAPLFISDITVADPNDPTFTYTLEGIFGMNFLVGSAELFQDPSGGIPNIIFTEGFFDFITYDDTTGLIGIQPTVSVVVPEPGVGLLAVGLLGLAGRRRRVVC